MDFVVVTLFLLWSLLLCIFEMKEFRIPTLFWWLNVIIFAFICCTRDLSVPDTIPYIAAFNDLNISDFTWLSRAEISNFEIGYSVLMRIVKILGMDYQLLFFIIVIINFYIFNKTLVEFKEYFNINRKIHFIFFPLYLSFFGIYYNAIVLRGGLAITFYIYSIFLIINKKYKMGLIIALISIFLHDSVVVAYIITFVAFLLPNFERKTYRIWIFLMLTIYLTGISNLIFDKIIAQLQNLISGYEMGRIYQSYVFKVNDTGIAIKNLYYSLIGLFFSFAIKEHIFPLTKKIANIYCLGITLAIIFSNIMAFSRLVDFFCIFYIFLLIAVNVENNNGKYRVNITDIALICIILANYIIINNNNLLLI